MYKSGPNTVVCNTAVSEEAGIACTFSGAGRCSSSRQRIDARFVVEALCSAVHASVSVDVA